MYRHPGQIVEAGNPDGDPRKATSWLWVCENLETVAWRFHHLHASDFTVAEVIELRYDPEGAISVVTGSSTQPVPDSGFSARSGYMKVKRAQLVGRVTDIPECVCCFGNHTPLAVRREQARHHVREKVAQLRAEAVLAGNRDLPHHTDPDPIEQLVRKKVAAARPRATFGEETDGVT